MVVRKRAASTAKKAPPTRKATAAPARRGRPPVKTAPKAAPVKDVTVYADKPATEYHKAFAKWLVSEVGYDPNSAPSKRAAFLAAIRLACTTRSEFMSSDFIEAWREETGQAKRGPKPKEEETRESPRASRVRSGTAKTRRVPREEEEVVEYGDDEDDDAEEFEEDFDDSDEDIDDDDDEYDSDEDEDDDSEDDDDMDDDDDDDEEPPARSRRAPAKRVARKAAPAKRAPTKKAPARRGKATADDDDFLF